MTKIKFLIDYIRIYINTTQQSMKDILLTNRFILMVIGLNKA